MSSFFIFSSESVCAGHPDKVCDQISDALVDMHLAKDPFAHLAFETAVTTNRVVILGEKRTNAKIAKQDIHDKVRQVIKEIGYEQPGFHWENLIIKDYIHEQSPDIAQGVDSTDQKDEGAGDQGIMFGYASNETESFMPAPICYAHSILKNIDRARQSGELSMICPDGKSQVSVVYENGKPIGTSSIVLSCQHSPDISVKQLRSTLIPWIEKSLPKGWLCPEEYIYINPTGRFVIGGPDGDTGLTGRKIIVDTYGGAAPHGGGAFSGKDPTKVDRSAAYMARYLAKNVVAAGLANRCCIQLSYAIGLSQPLSLYVHLYGSEVPPIKVENYIIQNIDLSPRGIREKLEMNRPIYQRTATYGHFGRTPDDDGAFSWEKLDLVEGFRQIL